MPPASEVTGSKKCWKSFEARASSLLVETEIVALESCHHISVIMQSYLFACFPPACVDPGPKVSLTVQKPSCLGHLESVRMNAVCVMDWRPVLELFPALQHKAAEKMDG